MKKFKNFVEKKKLNTGVAPEVLHFRMLEGKPTLTEQQTSSSHNEWLTRNDNSHLGTKEPINVRGGTHKPGSAQHYDYNTVEISKKLSNETYGRNLSNAHEKSVHKYVENSSPLNRSLLKSHKKSEEIPERHKKTIHHLDEVTRHPIGHELHVYSGVKFDPKKHISSEGHLHLPPYSSTTHDKVKADEFADRAVDEEKTKEKHILHIHLKSSDHAAHISHLSAEEDEHETILARNTTLHVNKTPTVLSDGTKVWHAKVHKQEK